MPWIETIEQQTGLTEQDLRRELVVTLYNRQSPPAPEALRLLGLEYGYELDHLVWERQLDQVQEVPIGIIVNYLCGLLGERLTAVIAGVKSAELQRRWAAYKEKPEPETDRYLQNTFWVVEYLMRWERPTIIKTWFMGTNPCLDDEPPAEVIQQDPEAVMGAANALITGSYC